MLTITYIPWFRAQPATSFTRASQSASMMLFSSTWLCQLTGIRMVLKPASLMAPISSGVVFAPTQLVSIAVPFACRLYPLNASKVLPRFHPHFISFRNAMASLSGISNFFRSSTTGMIIPSVCTGGSARPAAALIIRQSASSRAVIVFFRILVCSSPVKVFVLLLLYAKNASSSSKRLYKLLVRYSLFCHSIIMHYALYIVH